MSEPKLNSDSGPENPKFTGSEISDTELPELTETMAEIAAAEPQEPLERPEATPGGAQGPIISFNHVSISFDGRPVLEDVSFSVERGQTLCILGRSGVGKSVSLRLLMGFLQPDSGSIQVEGQEIAGLGEEGMMAIRKRITMVFQNGALFDSLSVRENVSFPLRERGGLDEDQLHQIVDRLIGLVGAEDVAGDRALRRTDDDGRSDYCAAAREPDSATQAPTGIYERGGHTRYALCRATCRCRAISRSGPSEFLRAAASVFGVDGSPRSAVSISGCLSITFDMTELYYLRHDGTVMS